MSLTNKNNTVYPMIDELVDILYNDDLNNLMDTKCTTDLDKKTFMMFILMYFYTYINIHKTETSKDDIKIFLSDLIKNPDKRKQVIELYSTVISNSIKFLN
jgi:hypothetical protein